MADGKCDARKAASSLCAGCGCMSPILLVLASFYGSVASWVSYPAVCLDILSCAPSGLHPTG